MSRFAHDAIAQCASVIQSMFTGFIGSVGIE
jgi:hypothetical protein